MKHPFTVGSTYANERGRYTVIEITPPHMRIRYEDGREQKVKLGIQARIWSRRQWESSEAAAAVRSRAQQTHRRRSTRRPQATFQGFLDTDFKDNVAGTSWRSRESLGGLVAGQLSARAKGDYLSYAMPREPRFFVYAQNQPMGAKAKGVKVPKFVVQLDTERLLYGFYIEKSDEPMDDEWFWPRFVDLIAKTRWQHALEQAMAEENLYWWLDLQERQSATGAYGPAGEITVSSFEPEATFETFDAFVDHLRGLPADQWCNLFLAATIAKQEALAKRAHIAEAISKALAALAPMYGELIGHSSRS